MINIIISNYNNSQYIPQCIESILSQSYNDFEIIFVDDCSTDNSISIAERYAEKDKRIRIVPLSENHGAGYARNVGLQNANGEWISFVDSDDYLLPDFYKTAIEYAEKYDCDICTCNISLNGKIKRFTDFDKYEIIDDKQIMMEGLISHKNLFLNNTIVKKKCFDGYGYCTRRYIEDTPTYAHCLMNCNRECFINHCGYFYRQNESSLTHKASTTKEALYGSLAYFEIHDIFKKYGYESGLDVADKALELVLMAKHNLLDGNEIKEKYLDDFNLLNKYINKYYPEKS